MCQAAVNFGRDNGLTVAVRRGGHSAQGYGMCDDALVIDVSPMKDIEVDPETRIVRAAGGLTWGEFDAATQEHGLRYRRAVLDDRDRRPDPWQRQRLARAQAAA